MKNARELIDELRGKRCRCGNTKRAEQTFCGKCYFKLPPKMRSALYKRISEGYEEAYADAVKHLDKA